MGKNYFRSSFRKIWSKSGFEFALYFTIGRMFMGCSVIFDDNIAMTAQNQSKTFMSWRVHMECINIFS